MRGFLIRMGYHRQMLTEGSAVVVVVEFAAVAEAIAVFDCFVLVD